MGIACALVGPALLACGGLFTYLIVVKGSGEALMGFTAIPPALCGLGAMISIWAWRLLTGRGRSADGGLLSPLALEAGGLFVALGFLLILARSPFALFDATFVLSMVVSCFWLARTRRRKARAARGERLPGWMGMRRTVIFLLLFMLLGFLVSVGWMVGGLPPPGMVLRYGVTPGCAPTGGVQTHQGVEFVEISAGCFRMGSTENAEGGDTLGKLCSMFGLPWGDQPKASDEMPVHWVEFPRGFWIARTEITNEQYERFKPDHERGKYAYSPGDRHPVVNVSWEDAKEYCTWLSEKSGLDIRLPSEAMWEAACRGGSKREFCFGDDEDRLGEFAWYNENSMRGAHEVGTRRANGWGLYDLHGNVWEWCEDTYHESYEDAPSDGSAWTEGGEERGGTLFRVRRGGCWRYRAGRCRSADRYRNGPGQRVGHLGFRPCLWPADD